MPHLFGGQGFKHGREDSPNDHAHAIKIHALGAGCGRSSLRGNQRVPQLGRATFERVPAIGVRFAVVEPATRIRQRVCLSKWTLE
jgi:hypothetical protein